MITRLTVPDLAAPLFGQWPAAILLSCLQGVMGAVYGDDDTTPRSAMACLGDFCFFGGTPCGELAALGPPEGEPLLIPQNEAWADTLRAVWGQRATPHTRYATRKDTVFDTAALTAAAGNLPPGDSLHAMDAPLYQQCQSAAWSRDLVANFPHAAAYSALGLGQVVLHRGRLVAGASSYAVYRDGIEIEIDTHPDFRRRGLARACGAALILSCLEQGRYPSWDAHDLRSIALAERLGYRLSHPYPVLIRT